MAAVSAWTCRLRVFDFVGIAGKLLLSKSGCKPEIVNRKLLPQGKSLAIGYLLALPEPILRTMMTILGRNFQFTL